MSDNTWQILFLLPNLSLREAIGNEEIAIVPAKDQRVDAIVSTSPIAKALVENFEDQFGRKVNPALLLIRDNPADCMRDIETLVAFRNILALPTIIRGYEHRLTNTFSAYPLYSDYFDFYPITISRENNGLIIKSPSVFGFEDQAENFRGQSSPALAGSDLVASPDKELFGLLQKAWKRRFIDRRLGEWQTRALFRSLEMAYQATAMPFKNHSTLYDFGTSASLWVSAFEILSHPKNVKADLFSVLNLLGKYGWADKQVKRRAYKVRYQNTQHKVNIVQALYKQLCNARNDFLHGNPIALPRLHPFGNRKLPYLTAFAPLIYKVALLSFMAQFKDRRRKLDHEREYIAKLLSEDDLADAILKSRE